MTDKQYEAQKRRVSKYLDKWQKPCGFGWWTIDVEFSRERDEDSPGTIGKCWSYWQYRSGTLRFYLPVALDNTDEVVEKSVLHELCHLIVSPLQDFSSDEKREITEYTTTLVAEALYWAHTFVKKEKDHGRDRSSKAQAQTITDKAEEGEEPRDLQSKTKQPVQEIGAV